MIFTAESQTVDFDFDFLRKFNKLGVSLSGGTDSALLLYLIAKYAPDITVHPYCGIDGVVPNNVWFAKDIHQIIIDKFPNAKIKPLLTFEINFNNPDYIKLANELPNPNNILGIGRLKQVIMDMEVQKFNFDGYVNALTANPSREEAKNNGFYHLCEERRFSDKIKNPYVKNNFYKPFINVNKKFIAGLYYKENIMEDIFPLTQSCVSDFKNTNGFTKPCGKCFWCYEKQWAFGSMDLCYE